MTKIEALDILLPVAFILLLSKLLQMGCKKIKLPQVVGMLLTGILIGLLNLLGPDSGLRNAFLNDSAVAGIKFLAEIGVVLIMFQAGLGTNIQQIKKCGFAAIIVTLMGVIVPMGLGFLVAGLFQGFTGSIYYCKECGKMVSDAVCATDAGHNVMAIDMVWSNLFYGVILTATSVSVTVATLNELGKLHGRAGTIIVSAAILDDIIGVVVLSVILSLSGTQTGAAEISFGNFIQGEISIGTLITVGNSNLSILAVLLDVLLFFIFVVGIGLLMHWIFKRLNKKKAHTRRVPIFGIAFAFFMAWVAESWFGIADITGAFFAGLALAGIGHRIQHPAMDELKDDTSDYIGRKSDVLLYMLFSPLFFAKVGITTDFSTLFKPEGLALLGFGLCLILAGLAGKVLGCGFGAKVTKHSWVDSLRVGIGMMARAEVALICATKGMEAGLINPGMSAFIVILIIVSSFVTPLVLKATYKNDTKKKEDYDEEQFTATNDHSIAEASPLSGNYNAEDIEP